LHFVDSDLKPSADAIRWDTGLAYVADSFAHLAQTQLDSFLALFAAGALLAYLRLLSPQGGLALCIGIHAGWVCVIKIAKPFSHRVHESPWAYFISDFDGVIGYFSAAWSFGLILALWIAARKLKIA
jgi:hypothetical protein